ncbi:unnamed protein product [Pleuronectes platessa]|uniref:Uncharacterized protein n=1 Tax=Pleuronectes platessa TaxID=8262 RepID=A0A9N7Z3A3_PLEPL|nr:unnamed protein product [Pleuronectes platessa]
MSREAINKRIEEKERREQQKTEWRGTTGLEPRHRRRERTGREETEWNREVNDLVVTTKSILNAVLRTSSLIWRSVIQQGPQSRLSANKGHKEKHRDPAELHCLFLLHSSPLRPVLPV